MSYTSIFLDLDNTLLDFNKAEYFAAQSLFKKHNLPFDDDALKTYSKINLSFWKRFERGEIKREDIFENRFIEFCKYYGKTANTKQMAPEYFEFLSQGYYIIDSAIQVLEYLKAKNYKLYATTNGVALTQYRRIKESGLQPYFDKIFISEETGFQKPAKEYFDFVIKNIPENDKEKILIVGDSQSSDILGGVNSGIDTCWYNPKKEIAKYYSKFEITDLLQLKTIL